MTADTEVMRYTVIGLPQTRTFRVIWALEEMSLPYTIEPARPHADSIKRINPAGKVPALRLTDNHSAQHEILDSVAITQFIADRHQKLTYTAGTPERGIQDSFTQFACDEIDSTLWQMAKHAFVWPEEMRNPDAIAAGCQRDLDRAFNSLAERLGQQQYVMGDLFTVPDIIIVHCCNWAERSNYEIQHDRIAGYLQRCRERPGYKRAMAVRHQHS